MVSDKEWNEAVQLGKFCMMWMFPELRENRELASELYERCRRAVAHWQIKRDVDAKRCTT
jgi:hypothetical protein